VKKFLVITISVLLAGVISLILFLDFKGKDFSTKILQQYFHQSVDINLNFDYHIKGYIIEISINNLSITNKENNKIASIDDISFAINPKNIFNNNFLLDNIKINNPFLLLSEIKIPESKSKSDFNINKLLKYIRFKSIELQNGKFIIETNELSYLWHIESLKTINDKNKSEIIINSQFAGMQTDLNLSLTHNISGESFLKIQYNNLPIFDFTKKFQDSNLPFFNIFLKQKNPILINGKIDILFAKNGSIDKGDLNIFSGQILKDPRMLSLNEKNLEITDFTCELEVKESLTYILLKNFEISFDDATNISTSFLLKQQKDYKNFFGNSIVYFGLTYDVKNIPVKHLSTLWPNFYEDKVRNWVVNNIHNGTVIDGKGGFSFGREFFSTGELEPSDINAKLNIKETDLKYYDDLPEIKKIEGSIIFTGDKLISYAKSATINSTQLMNTKIELPYDMNYLMLQGNTVGPIADFYNFIPEDTLNKMNDMKINIREIDAISESKIDINIPIKNDIDTDDLKIDIEAKTKNIVLSKEFEQFPFSDLFLKIVSINNNTTIQGSGISRNAELNLDFSISDKSDNYNCILNAKIGNKTVKSLGIDNLLKLGDDDIIPIKFILNKNNIEMTSDLSKPGFDLSLLGYRKEKNIPANLSSTIKIAENNSFLIQDLIFTSLKDKIVVNYNLVDGLYKGDIFLKKLGSTKNVKVDFDNHNDTINVMIKGDILDLSQIKLEKSSSDANDIKQKKQINIEINDLIMKNDEYFKKFILKYNSEPNGYINQLSIASQIKQNNSLLVTVKNVSKEEQQIIIYSDDAAAIFRALGIYQNILGGTLCARIDKKIIDGKDVFDGGVAIDNFYMTKQSFLTKLVLGLTSATGFINSNKGNAIYMNRFISKVTFINNVIAIDGLIIGPSLHIITKGNVDLNKDYVDIAGSIIPSLYGLNMGIARLPLIGPLLSGDEPAIFSANFTVKGPLDKTKISFNPFSLLPISFLKRIFNTK
jgi:hypothetical protein